MHFYVAKIKLNITTPTSLIIRELEQIILKFRVKFFLHPFIFFKSLSLKSFAESCPNCRAA